MNNSVFFYLLELKLLDAREFPVIVRIWELYPLLILGSVVVCPTIVPAGWMGSYLLLLAREDI